MQNGFRKRQIVIEVKTYPTTYPTLRPPIPPNTGPSLTSTISNSSEVSEMERLVEKLGAESLSARDQHGYTPAHWAALDGSVAVMRYLVERGAPVDLSCLGTQVGI